MRTVLLLMLIPVLLLAQVKRIIKVEGDIFEIPEIGAIVIMEKKNLKVEMVLPEENRPKAYKDVDLKAGDLILMMNGKKMDNSKKADELYKSLKPGEIVKLGIMRDGQMFISSFKKADPKDLPKVKRMIIKKGDGSDENKRVIIKPDKK